MFVVLLQESQGRSENHVVTIISLSGASLYQNPSTFGLLLLPTPSDGTDGLIVLYVLIRNHLQYRGDHVDHAGRDIRVATGQDHFAAVAGGADFKDVFAYASRQGVEEAVEHTFSFVL